MFRVVVFLLVTVRLPQTPAPTNGGQGEPYTDADAYEVYTAVIPSEWPLRVAKAKALVIQGETRAFEMCLDPDKESAEVVGPAISDYRGRNEKMWLLQEKFSLEVPYQVVTSARLKASFERGGWEDFYKEHLDSGSWIELSAVGFNPERKVAVVYVGHRAACCAAAGSTCYERKTGNGCRWSGEGQVALGRLEGRGGLPTAAEQSAARLTTACTRRPGSVPLMGVEWGRG